MANQWLKQTGFHLEIKSNTIKNQKMNLTKTDSTYGRSFMDISLKLAFLNKEGMRELKRL